MAPLAQKGFHPDSLSWMSKAMIVMAQKGISRRGSLSCSWALLPRFRNLRASFAGYLHYS
jgi:hypothetical protein